MAVESAQAGASGAFTHRALLPSTPYESDGEVCRGGVGIALWQDVAGPRLARRHAYLPKARRGRLRAARCGKAMAFF